MGGYSSILKYDKFEANWKIFLVSLHEKYGNSASYIYIEDNIFNLLGNIVSIHHMGIRWGPQEQNIFLYSENNIKFTVK